MGKPAIGDLGKDEFCVRMTAEPFPTERGLKKEFGTENVSPIFDGRSFKRHPSCRGVRRTPGDRIFLVAAPPESVLGSSEKIIAWARRRKNKSAPKGFRPATHEELYEFQRKHFINWLIALGSFAMDDDRRYVAVLRSDSSGRLFADSWFGHRWNSGDRFLFVRK